MQQCTNNELQAAMYTNAKLHSCSYCSGILFNFIHNSFVCLQQSVHWGDVLGDGSDGGGVEFERPPPVSDTESGCWDILLASCPCPASWCLLPDLCTRQAAPEL